MLAAARGLGIILIYWMIFTTGAEQARGGRVPVALGIWAANLVVFVWMIVAYLQMLGTLVDFSVYKPEENLR